MKIVDGKKEDDTPKIGIYHIREQARIWGKPPGFMHSFQRRDEEIAEYRRVVLIS